MTIDFFDTDNPDYPVKVRYDAAAGGDPLQDLGGDGEEEDVPERPPSTPTGPYRTPSHG